MKRSHLLIVTLLAVLTSVIAVPRPLYAARESAFEHERIGWIINKNGVKVTVGADAAGKGLGGLWTDERVIVIGRDVNNQWFRVRTRVGTGYIAATALQTSEDLSHVPEVRGDLPAPALPDAVPVDDPARFPVLPIFTAFMQETFRRGIDAGNLPDVFSKIGDCMSADKSLFLGEFATKYYELGAYTYLQEVIDYYRKGRVASGRVNPFWAESEAAIIGFTAASVEDPTWADPKVCNPGETPLACEYRRSKPSLAIIMFGTNDVISLTAQQFDFYLRLVVSDSVARGIVPLLMTFPGDPKRLAKSDQFNQIIFQVAQDYDVPTVNLWLALQSLPNHGRRGGTMYLSGTYAYQVAYFTPSNLYYGYTLRNLITLQALDILWHGIVLAA